MNNRQLLNFCEADLGALVLGVGVGKPPSIVRWGGWAFLKTSLNSFQGLSFFGVRTKEKYFLFHQLALLCGKASP